MIRTNNPIKTITKSTLWRVASIGLLTSLLAGCPAAAFMAGGAAGGAVAADHRSLGTISEDHTVVYEINKQIGNDADFSQLAHINVVSYNHVVLLVGQTPTDAQRNKAAGIASKVANVRRVYNYITVGQSTTGMTRSNDAMLTTNVKARMVATTNLDSNRVKVVTEDGVVYLMGLTTRDQADIATQVAAHSSGVKRVVKLIEITES